MKSFFSASAIFFFLLFYFQQGVSFVFFKLNQKAIEENFCVNKSKPQLQCYGKCYLKKELQKREHNAETCIGMVKNIEVVLMLLPESDVKTGKKIPCKKKSFYKEKSYPKPYIEVFVPPPIA